MKKSNYQWQLQTKTELPVEFIEQLKKEEINPLIGQLFMAPQYPDRRSIT